MQNPAVCTENPYLKKRKILQKIEWKLIEIALWQTTTDKVRDKMFGVINILNDLHKLPWE